MWREPHATTQKDSEVAKANQKAHQNRRKSPRKSLLKIQSR